jgi:hypothetical protein
LNFDFLADGAEERRTLRDFIFLMELSMLRQAQHKCFGTSALRHFGKLSAAQFSTSFAAMR